MTSPPDPSANAPADSTAIFHGLLVVTIEQAVAAPYATSRLAEAGARVIKIERPPAGDFARHYDSVAHGESAHFVWLNRGKQSAALDFSRPADMEILRRMLSRADVFIQNLSPGAMDRAGLAPDRLREAHPRLITCSISGYGESGPYAAMRAYDNLVQAETGLFAVTGNAAGPAKVGVSICDLTAGMNAYLGILEALFERQQTGRGRHVSVSLFESVADWMTVHFLFQRYAAKSAGHTGLNHASIAPYGPYAAGDGNPVMLAVQNDGEWIRLCNQVLERPDIARNPLFRNNPERVANRAALDEVIRAAIAPLTQSELISRLQSAQIAFGLIRTVEEFTHHPALQTEEAATPSGPVTLPRRVLPRTSLRHTNPVPALGQHTDAIRKEFSGS
jgi:crotonobetainyl-CoA:carnitine CoA-transferase CaiB-like acyl-CoA transferase